MSKQYDSGSGLHEKILEGVNVLADNVASTLGPRGRNVILHQKGRRPIVTKDGVTVAKFVDLEDPVQNVGVQILKEAAEQTVSKAGDGTTTSTVLARAILNNSQKYLIAGASPVELKRGMDKATTAIVTNLKNMSQPVTSEEDIRHIASISANNDATIGDLIATAISKAGKDGAISVEDGRSVDTTLDLVEGFRFDSGYFAKAFVTDERRGAVKYDSPIILVTDYKVDTVDCIYPVLELASRDGRPLVIVAEEVEGQALAALIMNTTRGTMKVSAVKAPRFGDERRSIMKDLCISTGATFISRESGINLSEVKLQHLGSCKTIEVLSNFTTVVDGAGNPQEIDERIEQLKEEIKNTDGLHQAERIQERVTRLASGVAIIRVGGATEVEMVERRHRIEDALAAVKAAQEEGMLPGGGVALARASQDLDVEMDNEDQRLGMQIILESVKAPIKQMAQNAGVSPDIVLEKVLTQEGNLGFDFTRNEIVDMFESGVIDPAKVTRSALENAVSVASTLVTTNHAIVEN